MSRHARNYLTSHLKGVSSTYHSVGDLHPRALQDGYVSLDSWVAALDVDVVATTGGVVSDRSRVPGRGSALHSRPVEGVVRNVLEEEGVSYTRRRL